MELWWILAAGEWMWASPGGHQHRQTRAQSVHEERCMGLTVCGMWGAEGPGPKWAAGSQWLPALSLTAVSGRTGGSAQAVPIVDAPGAPFG